jgi:hypothetical protein
METHTLDSIWYRAEPHTESTSAHPFVRERGTLHVSDEELRFRGRKTEVVMRDVQSVEYGVHGTMRNPSVHVRYRDGEAVRSAYFTDGRLGGYAGLFGGTRKLAELLGRGREASFDDAAAGTSQWWWIVVLSALVLFFLLRVVLALLR